VYVGNANDVAAIVKDRRQKLGWTQQNLADAMGVIRQWWCRWRPVLNALSSGW
jgi:transcriptional regulator with XRE-family HTH domain